MTSPMRVLVADDELLARKRLVRLLAAIEGAELVGECTNGNEVVERVRAGDIDLVLLDIQMPGLTGIEALGMLGDDAPLVILCTAHPDYALDAFEMGALDYVVKPVEAGRLKKALDRALALLCPKDTAAAEPLPALARLGVATRQGIVLLDPAEISHAILDGELVSVVADDATHISDDTLGDLQDRLPRETFARVHRRALVNLARIVRLEPIATGGFVAHMRGGHRVEVSRQSARELKKRLGLR